MPNDNDQHSNVLPILSSTSSSTAVVDNVAASGLSKAKLSKGTYFIARSTVSNTIIKEEPTVPTKESRLYATNIAVDSARPHDLTLVLAFKNSKAVCGLDQVNVKLSNTWKPYRREKCNKEIEDILLARGRSKSWDESMSSQNQRVLCNPPVTLATVLENMPLVYNSTTKSLERSNPKVAQNQVSTANNGVTTVVVSPPISAIPEVDDAISKPGQSTICSDRAPEDAKMFDAASTSPVKRTPFRRGHIRHSSYESAQIQLLPKGAQFDLAYSEPKPIRSSGTAGKPAQYALPSVVPSPSSALVGRANSLNRNADPSSLVPPTIGALSRHQDAECSTSAASIETGQTMDSAVGDSVSSKRSSLDRKSQTSFVDWASDADSSLPATSPRDPADDEGFFGHGDDIVAGDGPSSSAGVGGPKRKGLQMPSILPKGLFSRSSKQPPPNGSPPVTNGTPSLTSGPWRIFADRRPSKDPSIVSTTGLILENRPSNLPAKPDEEVAKHAKQYLELIDAVKKKEQKEAKERKRAKEVQRRLEDQAAAALKQWQDHILPKWDEMRNSKRCRELWWQGIPSKVRGRVWSMVIGNDLSLTKDLYNICCARARERLAHMNEVDECEDRLQKGHQRSVSAAGSNEEVTDRECTVELIHLDVSRTFPNLGIFQKGGPYYDLLLNLLGAYVCYRPDVGYVQSMSFVAAVLLLQMDAYDAFVAFANLLNRPLQLAFFRLLQPQMTEYFIAYDQYFEQELPKLHAHFDQLDVRPDLYLIEWVYTMYAKSLPLDVTCRVWDMYLRDDEEFLFKTALGILRSFEGQLLDMDFEGIVQFLAHLPDTLTGSELFKNVEPFMRPYAARGETTAKGKRRFLQILADVNERINPSPQSPDKLTASSCGGRGSNLGHARRPSDGSQCSQLSQLSTNVQNVKMSKSLSGFLGDLLKPTQEEAPNL